MEMHTKKQSVFKEVLYYALWLILGIVPVLLLIFMVAFLVIRTTVVPHQALILVVASIWLVTYLRLKKNNMSYSDIWLRFRPRSKLLMELILGFIVGAAIITIVFTTLWVTGLLTFTPVAVTSSLALALFTSLFYTLIQSGTEELIFRGYLLKILVRKSGTFSILVTSVVFSMMHFHHGVNLVGWFNIFLFGVLTAQMVFTWNTLWMPIGFHVGWNFFQHDLFAFSVYGWTRQGIFDLKLVIGRDIITGGSYGPEGSMITTLILLIIIGLLILLANKKYMAAGGEKGSYQGKEFNEKWKL